MVDMEKFEISEILASALQLKKKLRAALLESADEKVADLVGDVDSIRISAGTSEAEPLTIAFVGQYNAGKSTTIHVLTGREDIVIDSNVCTDRILAYDWDGILLLDTPGIHAGYADHDEKTYAAIDKADLLVFVITNELFDDTIGRHFRELAITRDHAHRILLVVNKMGQDPGTPETKRIDIEKVTAPRAIEDFKTVFIDARSWLEAQEADPQDRDDLLEIANIPALITALNAFVRERGLSGRLSSPLFALRTIADDARAYLSTDIPEERATLELLHQKRGMLLTSKSRLSRSLENLLAGAVSDIRTAGDRVAELVELGRDQQELESRHADAQAKVQHRCETLVAEAREYIDGEISNLQTQLDALRDGALAQGIRTQVEVALQMKSKPDLDGQNATAWQISSRNSSLASWPAKAKLLGEIAENISVKAAKWTLGSMTEGVAIGSANAVRGSDAHKMVYDIGKYFGVKFKPWEAVNYARTLGKIGAVIGNVGRLLGVLGGVLAVASQFSEEQKQDEQNKQLLDARNSIRGAFRDHANEVQSVFLDQMHTFIKDFYDSELEALGNLTSQISTVRSDRSTQARNFDELSAWATSLIRRVEATLRPAE